MMVTPAKGVWTCALPACLLAIACLAPYLGKAYVTDDPVFMLTAEQALRTPLDPLGYKLCWNGFEGACGAVGGTGVNAPMTAYLLTPSALLGSREWVTHLLELAFLCGGIVAAASLALRLGASLLEAAGAGLMLASMPLVLPTASSAMPDIPSMALGIIGVDLFLGWKRGGGWWRAAGSALALGLAPAARMHTATASGVALLLLPDGWVFDWRAWRAAPWRRALPLAGAVAVFAAVEALARTPGGNAALPPQLLGRNLFPNLRHLFWYWAFPAPFAAGWLLSRDWRARRELAVAAGFLALLLLLATPPAPLELAVSLGAVAGLLSVADVLLEARAKQDSAQFALGCWLLAALPICLYNNMAIKYLAASAPAAAILLARALLRDGGRAKRLVFAAAVAYGAVFSLMILTADRDFAEMGRAAGREIVAPRVAKGEKVWFYGAWGFHWYAQKQGAQELMPEAQPRPGDTLVIGAAEGGRYVLSRVPRRTLLERRTVAHTGGRTMDLAAHAGLYSRWWGPLPWGWGSGEVNVYEVWRVD